MAEDHLNNWGIILISFMLVDANIFISEYINWFIDCLIFHLHIIICYEIHIK